MDLWQVHLVSVLITIVAILCRGVSATEEPLLRHLLSHRLLYGCHALLQLCHLDDTFGWQMNMLDVLRVLQATFEMISLIFELFLADSTVLTLLLGYLMILLGFFFFLN